MNKDKDFRKDDTCYNCPLAELPSLNITEPCTKYCEEAREWVTEFEYSIKKSIYDEVYAHMLNDDDTTFFEWIQNELLD